MLGEVHRPGRINAETGAHDVSNRGLSQQWRRRLDITCVYSHPHEHENNGSSERTWRDNNDLAHTMMATNEFPSTGWTNYAELSQPNCNFVHVPSARLNELRFAEQVYVGHSDA